MNVFMKGTDVGVSHIREQTNKTTKVMSLYQKEPRLDTVCTGAGPGTHTKFAELQRGGLL